MATGASAAKRKAKKAIAGQYYKVFSDLERANENVKIGANNKKAIVENLGDDVSYGTKRLAMQADKVATNINSDEEYKGNLGKYNQRYDALKKQLSGQSVERYSVSDSPNVAVEKPAGIAGLLQSQFAESPDKIGKSKAGNTYFNSQEEAMQYAESAMVKHNDSLNSKIGSKVSANAHGGSPMANMNNIGSVYTKKDAELNKVSDASKFVNKETLNGIDVGYRQLNEMGEAYGELEALSENAGNSAANKNIEQYSALSEKLKLKLRREDSGPLKSGGLLASELAGSNLDNGVIKT